jgi:hypothetical protein
MSDFLDRLASRAIGGDTALLPRLPSLFEPLQKTPILPLSDEGGAPSRDRDVPWVTATAPPAVPVQPMHAASAAERSRARALPGDPSPVSEPEHVAAPAQRHTLPSPRLEPAPRSAPSVERPAAPSTPAHPAATSLPSLVPPRQTRIAAERQAPAPPSASGSLRPAPVPVFGAPHAGSLPAPSGPVATQRVPALPAGRETGVSSEPVVHVSIGRLEVRAVAATGTTPRRRDGPQPSSLDNYLRERGDKASR